MGGFEVIEWIDVDLFVFGLDEVCFCLMVVGLNYIDIYYWSGLYLMVLFSGFGSEVVGVVEVVGVDVDFKVGDCVVIFGLVLGVYVIECNIVVNSLFFIFDDIDDVIVVVGFLKGCMMEFFVECCVKV